MRFNQDYTGVEEQTGGFEIIPDGTVLNVMIEEVRDKTTQKGDNMASVAFKVVSGIYENRWIWDNIAFVDGMNGRNKHFLKVIDQPYEDKFTVDTDAWPGVELKIMVGVDEYQGKSKNIVKRYMYLDEDAPKNAAPENPEDSPF